LYRRVECDPDRAQEEGRKMRKHRLLICLALVVGAVLACNPPGGEAPTATPEPLGEVSPTAARPTEGPTETPVPDVTGPGGCTLNAAFVSDVTVPDDTAFAPGQSFTKTWRVRNTGTCAWEAGTTLIFSSGDRMGGPDSVPVGAVAAGSTVDVSVNLTAPTSYGTYRGNWQLRAPDGTRFGSIVYVRIVVPEPATVTPTPTATPTQGPTVTPTEEGCEVPVGAALAPILEVVEDAGYDLECPLEAPFDVGGAYQEFWSAASDRSVLIWRSDEREIYGIVGEDPETSGGMLLSYTDLWEEGDPAVHPDCDGMAPPAPGLFVPVRGFGRVWCVNELWDVIGWPFVPEQAATLRVQPMGRGVLMRVTLPGGERYLVALDYAAVYGWMRPIGP